MNVRDFINRKFKVYWNKSYDVKWLKNKFDLGIYHFKEGEVSRTLSTSKKAISCGVEMTKSDEIFNYFTFKISELQELFNNGIISFTD